MSTRKQPFALYKLLSIHLIDHISKLLPSAPIFDGKSIGEDLMVGIGRNINEDGETAEIKLSLFYISDPKNIKEIHKTILKEYGNCEVMSNPNALFAETSDLVYIGSDFPDEFVHSKDTKTLRGANLYAKANSSGIVKEMIEIAGNKTFAENYAQKHHADAKYGWYRYDTRFAIPIYDDDNELVKYNVFKARIVVRHAADGKLYLYDILRTKKKRADRLSNSCTVVKLISL